MALVNLASSYIALGNYEKSVELQKEALEIHEKTLGPWHPYTAQSLRELGISYQKLKQFENSLEAFRRSLDINERSFGHRHPETARSLVYVGNAYYDIEKYTDALAMQQKALEITKDISESPHPDVARRLHNIALVYDKLGQQDYVRPLFQEALQIFELTLGEGHPDTALSRSHLASELAREGYVDLSIALFKLTINAYQSQRQRIAEIGGAELKSYTDTISTPYQSLSDLLISRGRLAEAQMVLDMLKEDEQFEFIRRSTSANPRKSRIDFNSIESASMDRYRHAYSQLAALVAEDQALQKKAKLGLTEAEKERLKALVADLVIAKSAFESFLKEMQEVFAAQGPARAAEMAETSSTAARNLQSLIKDLGHDSVLLQYYVTEDKVGMLLTTQGVQLARSGNVNARDLNRQIAEFRRLLRDPKSDPLRASQALYQLLVAPVAQDLEQAGARTVMLSLDGALRYLPFGALHDGQKYLVQRWNLPMYTSVTRNKLKDDVAPQWQAAGLGVTKAVRDFAALPAVKIEMGSIVRTVSGGVLQGEVYLDEAFTAQRLKDVSQRQFQVLHVASHFRFSPGTEVNSFLLLGDGQQLTLGDIRTQNYRFDKVDLLTLSACDTGLGGGRDEKGREIEGFGVIAQQQGAKAVLATLWPVADQSTAILMADMYRRRQDDRLTKTEALRQAQLALLANSRYAHPFYWAPFILMGNWK